MPTIPLEDLEAQVGETHETVVDLHVEAGKVEEFARAVHDPAPVYRSADAAREAGHPAVPAPPTFTRTWMFPRYQAEGVDHDFGFDLGFDWQYVLHGEQRYEYERPVYVGDALSGETTLEDVYRREGGQGGTMTFAVFRTDFSDAGGEHVLSAYNTRIETAGAVQDDAAADGSGRDRGAPDAAVESAERQDFVKYAGASGDFNPIHYDEPYATDAGNPSVFGQGMFSAGVASRAVRERFGLDGLDSFGTRFTSRVFPGDTLRVFLTEREPEGEEVEGDEPGRVAVDVEVVTDDGRTVVEGSATGRE